MLHFRTAQTMAWKEPIVTYAPIARSLLILEESERERMRPKFDICYMNHIRGCCLREVRGAARFVPHPTSVNLSFAYCVPSLLLCIALTDYELMIVHFSNSVSQLC